MLKIYIKRKNGIFLLRAASYVNNTTRGKERERKIETVLYRLSITRLPIKGNEIIVVTGR